MFLWIFEFLPTQFATCSKPPSKENHFKASYRTTVNYVTTVDYDVALSPFETNDDDCYSRQCFRLVQFTADEFWKRWLIKYPRTILTRNEWHEKRKILSQETLCSSMILLLLMASGL